MAEVAAAATAGSFRISAREEASGRFASSRASLNPSLGLSLLQKIDGQEAQDEAGGSVVNSVVKRTGKTASTQGNVGES